MKFSYLARNAKMVASHPSLAFEYIYYLLSKMMHGGEATRKIHGVTISHLNSYSEYRALLEYVDHTESAFFKQYDFGQGIIVDVGANLGLVSLILAKRFPEREIFAYEPSPIMFDALTTNIKLNKCHNVKPIQAAVADTNEDILFNADPLARGNAAIGDGPYALAVKCTKLDSLFADRQIALLKVDVEGFEDAVFRGAKNLLGNGKINCIYYEVAPHLTKALGKESYAATRILIDAGYSIYELNERGELCSAKISEIDKLFSANWIAFTLPL